jgi:hypothetical protein
VLLILFILLVGELTAFGGLNPILFRAVEAFNGTAWLEVGSLADERYDHAMVLLPCQG